MTGLFNIAVADFGEVHGLDNSAVSPSGDGQTLAQEVAEQLDGQLKAIPDLAGKVKIRHEQVGFISGSNLTERTTNAAGLATKLNADVIIYGYIDLKPVRAQFVPQFYITPRLTGAEELTGDNTFGQAVNVRLPLTNTDNRENLDNEIIPRFDALAKFMMGLAYFQGSGYERAIDRFQLADEVSEWKNGKEVLYLWSGTVFHELARHDEAHPCWLAPSVKPDDPLGCAQAAYQRALGPDPKHAFPRAQIGLGNLWLDSAERGDVIDCSAYEPAIKAYESALSSNETSTNSTFLPLKVEYNIGLTFAMAYQNSCDDVTDTSNKPPADLAVNHLSKAESAYEQALQQYPNVILVQQLGARILYQLGIVHNEQKDYKDAISNFTKAIMAATPKNSDYEEAWQSIRWNAQLQRGNAYTGQVDSTGTASKNALEDYEAVIKAYRDSRFDQEAVVSEAFYKAGVLYNLQGNTTHACDYFTAVDTLPDADAFIKKLTDEEFRKDVCKKL